MKWMGCCCGGTQLIEEAGTEEFSFGGCRDVMFHHPRTKSCEFLAHLPSSISLDSGYEHIYATQDYIVSYDISRDGKMDLC